MKSRPAFLPLPQPEYCISSALPCSAWMATLGPTEIWLLAEPPELRRIMGTSGPLPITLPSVIQAGDNGIKMGSGSTWKVVQRGMWDRALPCKWPTPVQPPCPLSPWWSKAQWHESSQPSSSISVGTWMTFSTRVIDFRHWGTSTLISQLPSSIPMGF